MAGFKSTKAACLVEARQLSKSAETANLIKLSAHNSPLSQPPSNAFRNRSAAYKTFTIPQPALYFPAAWSSFPTAHPTLK
ncbi:MAG: hypothetical protein ACOYN4_04575 [Bacteroidales bacterium]